MPRVPVVPTQQLNPQGPAQYSAPGVVPVQDQSPRQAMAMGEAFQQAGAQWGAYAADIQRRQDITEAEESLNKVAEDDAKAYSAFRQLDGKAAVNAFEAFDKDQQQRYKLAAERARNDQQRQWLKEKLGDRRVQVFSQAVSHKDGQLAVYRYGVAQATTKQAVTDAVTFADTPERDTYMAAVHQRATEQAQLAGVDPEPVAKMAMQDVHLGVAQKLVDTDKPGEAVQWLEAHKGEMDSDAYAKANRVARGRFVEWGARQLDQTVPDIRQRMDVIKDWEANKRITGDEAESARRHVLQLEDVRQKQQAEVGQALRLEGEKWLRANPALSITDNPELASQFRAMNMPFPERVYSTDPKFAEQLQSLPPAAVQQIERMSDAQLLNFLRPGLDDHDLKKWTAFFRGDQDIVGRQDRIKRAAEVLGVVSDPVTVANMSREARAANAQKLSSFEAQVQRQVDMLRANKKRDLTTREIQEEVLDPMMAEGNKVTGPSGNAVPVVSAQIAGDLPYDDPSTPSVDESLDLSKFPKAADYSVPVDGKPVFLRDVPMAVRKAIRDSWAKDNPGKQMTVAQEIEEYARVYRPKMEAAKQAEQSANVWRQMWGLPPGAPTVPPEQFKQAMKDR